MNEYLEDLLFIINKIDPTQSNITTHGKRELLRLSECLNKHLKTQEEKIKKLNIENIELKAEALNYKRLLVDITDGIYEENEN